MYKTVEESGALVAALNVMGFAAVFDLSACSASGETASMSLDVRNPTNNKTMSVVWYWWRAETQSWGWETLLDDGPVTTEAMLNRIIAHLT